MQRTSRLKRELQMLARSPPHGISCWQEDDKVNSLKAKIIGSEGTPYAGGIFEVDIAITDRYPFEPPKLRFITPIYHPNIDSGGRICLDTLKMPPQGAWKPSLNIGSVLTSIQLLMAEPNPDDPLMADVASEYKYNKHVFIGKAKQWTNRHAKEQCLNSQDKGSETGLHPSCSSEEMDIQDEESESRYSGETSNSRKRILQEVTEKNRPMILSTKKTKCLEL